MRKGGGSAAGFDVWRWRKALKGRMVKVGIGNRVDAVPRVEGDVEIATARMGDLGDDSICRRRSTG